MSDPTQLRPPVSDPTQLRPPVSDPTQPGHAGRALGHGRHPRRLRKAVGRLDARALRALGGVLTPEVRSRRSAVRPKSVMRIVYADLGLEPDPRRWPNPRTGCTSTRANCSRPGCPGCPAPTSCSSAGRRRRADGTGHQHPPGPHRAALNSIGAPLLLGDGVRRRGGARQARARRLRACRRVARLRSGAVPGHRGLRDGHRGGRGGGLPGGGGAQRRRGAGRPAAHGTSNFAEPTSTSTILRGHLIAEPVEQDHGTASA